MRRQRSCAGFEPDPRVSSGQPRVDAFPRGTGFLVCHCMKY